MKEIRIEAVYHHEYEKDQLIEVLVREFPDSAIYVNSELVQVPDDK